MPGKGLLERLDAGEIVVGDGGFVFELEKRGYVKAGPWTPEVCVEHPSAVEELHREFGRAGCDIFQAFSFYASDDKLKNRGNDLPLTSKDINKAACELARTQATKFGGLFAGGVSQTPTYLSVGSKAEVQEVFRVQYEVFLQEKVDFLILEYFEHIEEMEWAIEEAVKTGVPIMATMCINKDSDLHGVTTEECGARMAKAGAHVIGANCHFGPMMTVETVKAMKVGVEKAGLKAHYVTQPLGYVTTDVKKAGFVDLPEFPFALEPRQCTRTEIAHYARAAYEAGIHYIGGCCGFEAYHIRAVCEELEKERGRLGEASQKHAPWGGALIMHTKPMVRARSNRDYWETLKPASGRPWCASLSNADNWGITQGHQLLKQHVKETSADELKELMNAKKELAH